MALDFCILIDQIPTKCFELGVNTHGLLINDLTKSLNIKLLNRIYDYYEDVDFLYEDLVILQKEIIEALTIVTDKNVVIFLKELNELCVLAKSKNQGISVLAD
ncbi:MAG: hypothetical protein JWQ09_49 [Segetibacter sp.]|nr:hypothetical protein [Segetibacter sp.]